MSQENIYSLEFFQGRGGGTGRRASLRSWWEKSHAGSNPALGTKKSNALIKFDIYKLN